MSEEPWFDVFDGLGFFEPSDSDPELDLNLEPAPISYESDMDYKELGYHRLGKLNPTVLEVEAVEDAVDSYVAWVRGIPLEKSPDEIITEVSECPKRQHKLLCCVVPLAKAKLDKHISNR